MNIMGFHEVSPQKIAAIHRVQTARSAWDDSEDHWNSAWDISSTINSGYIHGYIHIYPL